MAEILNTNDMITQYQLAVSANQKDANMIRLLNVHDEMNIDTPYVACNQGQQHLYTHKDTFPEAEFHGYNMGSTAAATSQTSYLEGLCYGSRWARVDKKLADDSGNWTKYLAEYAEDIALGMGRQNADLRIYGNKSKNIYQIDGLATRLSNAKDKHVIVFNKTVAASKNPTSIYICALGKDKFHFIYDAKFGNAGVKRGTPAQRTVDNAPTASGQNNGTMIVYEARFETQWGLCIEHPDSVYRITNIPTVDLTASDRERLIDLVLETQDFLPPGTVTSALYGNVRIKQMVEKAAREKQVVVFAEKDPWGNPVNTINGMRVRRMDAIKCGATEML